MDEIRSRTSKLRTDEEALLNQRADAARGTLTTSIFSAIVGGSATVGMLILTRFRFAANARCAVRPMNRCDKAKSVSDSLPSRCRNSSG